MVACSYCGVTSATRVFIFQYEILLNCIPTVQKNIEPIQVKKMGKFYKSKKSKFFRTTRSIVKCKTRGKKKRGWFKYLDCVLSCDILIFNAIA